MNHLMEEKNKIRCDVLGLSETHQKKEASSWRKNGSAVRFGKVD